MQTDLTGRQLGPYNMQRLLGVGGMAEVYLAYHEWMPSRPVALKLLLPHLTTPEFVKRFSNEAAWLSQLHHRNIVQVYDAGQVGGRWYIAQEYLDGEPLDQTIYRAGRIPFHQAAWIATQVADALDYAYSYCNLVHRDVKPGNVMLLRDGTTAKLLDFGIAAVLWGERKARTPIGTFDYAAPEQIRGQADHLSDVYSLGATLYDMVVGQPPQWRRGGQLIWPSQFTPPIKLPPQLEQLIVRTLEANPARRPRSARETAVELRQMQMSWRPPGEHGPFATRDIPSRRPQTPPPRRPQPPRRPPSSAPGAWKLHNPRHVGNTGWIVLLLAALVAFTIVATILAVSARQSPRPPGAPTEWIITPQNPNLTPPSYTVTPGPRTSLTPTPSRPAAGSIELVQPDDGAASTLGKALAMLKCGARKPNGAQAPAPETVGMVRRPPDCGDETGSN